MAEIGLIASVAGVAGAGAKLSMLLYDFALTVALARKDINSVGRDISLFSGLLKEVGRVLGSQKGVRFSTTAIDTTFGIVDRCQVIFNDLHGIVQGLKRDKADGSSADARAMEVLRTQLGAETETKNKVVKALAIQKKI